MTMEQKKTGKKRIKIIGVILLVLLVVGIFFSNTVYTFNMPVVTAVAPKSESLSMSEKSSGVTDWAEKTDIFMPYSGTVAEIFIAEGDYVVAGQKLMRIEYDRESLTQRLSELEISKQRTQIDIEGINLRIARTNDNIRLLQSEAYTADEISRFEIDEQERQISTLKANCENALFLFEIGEISRLELEKAENDLASAISRLENMNAQFNESTAKAAESVDEKEKNRERQLTTYRNDLSDYEQQLRLRDLDYESLLLSEELTLIQLERFDDTEIVTAPADGTVYFIGTSRGRGTSENSLIASIGVGYEFIIDCIVSIGNNFVAVGDAALIHNASYRLEAVVTRITADDFGKRVTLSVESDIISAAETFDIEFRKTSDRSFVLVPNGALNMDGEGYFVYRLSRRDGILGREFYAAKAYVEIGDSDSENTVITKGIDFFLPIVLLSDRPFSEGQALKISNESDFFDNR